MKLALDVEIGPRLRTGPQCESYIYIGPVLALDVSPTLYIYMRRLREYTSNRHNISVALDPHGMLKLILNGEIIINSANMYLINLYPSAFAFRLHQRSKINKKIKKLSYNIYIFQKQYE